MLSPDRDCPATKRWGAYRPGAHFFAYEREPLPAEARYPRDNSRIPALADFSRKERKTTGLSREPAGQRNFIHFLLARGEL